jgi:hypothetical protein
MENESESSTSAPKTFTVTEESLARMVNAAVTSQLKNHKSSTSVPLNEDAIYARLAERLNPKTAISEPSELEVMSRKLEAMEKRERDATRRQVELQSIDHLRTVLQGKVKADAIPVVLDILKGKGIIDHASQTMTMDGESLTYADGVSRFVTLQEAKFFLDAPLPTRPARLASIGAQPVTNGTIDHQSPNEQIHALIAQYSK